MTKLLDSTNFHQTEVPASQIRFAALNVKKLNQSIMHRHKTVGIEPILANIGPLLLAMQFVLSKFDSDQFFTKNTQFLNLETHTFI